MAKDKEIYLGADGHWYNEDDNPICARRRKNCDVKKGGCGHNFTTDEYDLWECPECGKDRHCRIVVEHAGDACKFHGGLSLKGAASPQYKHGGYSKYLPTDIASRYEEFQNDPTKLSLEHEMSLIRAMISERIDALQRTNSAEAWERLRKTYNEMMAAQRQKERDRFAQLLLKVGEIIEEGAGVAATRKEIIRMTETERKLVDAQRQLYIDMGEFITRGMALTMFSRFMEAVKDHVLVLPGGAKALSAIAGSIRGMVGEVRRGRPRQERQVIEVSDHVAE